ncbi:MAG: cell division protein FtsZ [Bacteroidales bacterium]|nr:cell division protein FtsZ [Bacteroidales bacterium]
MTPEDIRDTHEFASSPAGSGETSYSPNKIKVIGVGGGGNNAINYMYNLGVRNVTFIVANTDNQALRNSPVPTKVLLGPNTLRGRGAGNVPDRARQAAEESAQEIDQLFDDDTDMVFITAGMGGGTGTGASPVVARIARERGLLTIGIVTIPFLFEGPKKILKALDGAKELGQFVDALLIINNDRISEIYKDFEFMNAFGKADDILAQAAISISEIVTCDGYMNLDFNDVDNTLRDGHTAIISTGYGEGEHRVTKAIEDAINSPLLRNTDIMSSRKLLFNLYYSRNADQKFLMEETNEITKFISSIDPEVDVIWGVAFDDTLGNKVKFTILAAGFDLTISEGAGGKTVAPHESGVVVRGDKEAKELADRDRLQAEYGSKVDKMNQTREELRYFILQPEQLDNDQVIEALESYPAYNRDKKVVNKFKNEANAPVTSTIPQAQVKEDTTTIAFDDL